MKLNIVTIVLIWLLPISISAQNSKRTNVWYFGRNAGVDFSTTPPTPLTNGALNLWEGCATLCDTSGQLMIYTDGIKIWNKNHQVLTGATNLGGDNSSTQSGIIVPKPNSTNEIYVFSVDNEGQSGGLRYAMVDMNLDGGLGGLISSNNVLLAESTEKITAIQHCNNRDFWIIAHQTNSTNFYVWKITKAGLYTPMITSIGSYHGTYTNAIGYLKGSPNGSKIALGVYGSNFFEVFDFDNSTGAISNPVTLTNPQFSNPYGVEFSLNSELLYVAGTQSAPKIFQFNLNLPTTLEIQNSGVIVGRGTSSHFGAIQLAPNGTIYVAKDSSDYLSVITNPNGVGASCNFIENDFYLGGKKCALGLPNLIPSYFEEVVTVNIIQNTDSCSGKTELVASTNAQGDSILYQWYFNGNYIQNQHTAIIQVNLSGEYLVRIFVYSACQLIPNEYMQATMVNIPPIVNSEYIQATICQGASMEGHSASGIYVDTFKSVIGCDSIRTLNLTVLPIASNNQIVTICENETPYEGHSISGVYKDTLQSANGCDSIRTLTLTVLPSVSLLQTATICENETPYEGHSISGVYEDTLQSANGCDSIRTLTLTVLPSASINQTVTICDNETPYEGHSTSGFYEDTLQSVNGCDSIRTLNLTVLPIATLHQTVNICENEVPYEGHSTSGIYVNNLVAANGCDSIRTLQLSINLTYETNKNITICEGTSYDFFGQLISSEGEYEYLATSIFGCDSIISIYLLIANGDFLGNDTTICMGTGYQLVSPSESTIWSDNTIAKTKNIKETGEYWGKFFDVNGCEIVDTVFVQFNIQSFVPNIFSPNDDGINDCFKPSFPKALFKSFKFNIFDRWGTLIYNSKNEYDCWNGDFRGKKCDVGVYTYFIEIETEFCKKTVIKGDVTLLK